MKEIRELLEAWNVLAPELLKEGWDPLMMKNAVVAVQSHLDAQEKRQSRCNHPPTYAMDGSRSATDYCPDCGLFLGGTLPMRVLNARELIEVFRSVAREEITASRACDMVNDWLLGTSAREIVEKLPLVTGGVELSQ